VAPGRSVATLVEVAARNDVEVAARNELLKAQGYNAARTLTSRLGAQPQDGAEAQGRMSAEGQESSGARRQGGDTE
jgi:hypothetical protein